MIFKFIQPISTTPCGLPLAPSITIIMKSKLLCVVTDEEGKWLLEGEGQVELIYILRIDDVEDHSARERLTD